MYVTWHSGTKSHIITSAKGKNGGKLRLNTWCLIKFVPFDWAVSCVYVSSPNFHCAHGAFTDIGCIAISAIEYSYS